MFIFIKIAFSLLRGIAYPVAERSLSVQARVVGRMVVAFFLLFGYFSIANAQVALSELQEKIEKQGSRWIATKNSAPAALSQRFLGAEFSSPSNAQAVPPASCVPGMSCKPGTQAPDSFSLRYKMTDIKDQGQCGTCTTFAAVGVLEGIYKNQTGKNIDLSEQEVASCSNIYSVCTRGAYLDDVAGWIKNNGLITEEVFPYTSGTTGLIPACASLSGANIQPSQLSAYRVSNASDLKQLLWELKRPLLTAFYVPNDFFYYQSGVYKHVSGGIVGGHAVVVVGYDDVDQSFLIRNSWSSDWGENGYFRISYDEVSPNSATNFATAYGVYTFDAILAKSAPRAPTPNYPNGPISQSKPPIYVWNAVVDASEYQLEVDGVPGAWLSTAVADCGTGTGTCEVSGGLLPIGSGHKWKVKSRNIYGESSLSEAISFSIVKDGNYVNLDGLSWMPIGAANPSYNWNDANAYCSNRSIDGRTGWRLPTRSELLNLYASRATANQDWMLGLTWSSTAASGGHSVFNLNDGTDTANADSAQAYLTCVYPMAKLAGQLSAVLSFLLDDDTGSAPVCTLTANPNTVNAGTSSTLTASCTPAASSYTWTGGTCAGTSSGTCTVTPTATTTYTVAGTNSSGTSTAASATVTVSACSSALNVASASVAATASTGSVNVTSTCAWTATSNASWISITSGASGSGNGIVSYAVAANTSTTARTGTLAIAGKTFTVTQAGSTGTLPPDCTLTANPSSITAGASVTLTASCNPAATSYIWTGGTCAGTTGSSCTVAPTVTTIYTVTGVNAGGSKPAASATVTVSTNTTSTSHTVPGTLGGDVFVLTAGDSYYGGGGNDTFIISPHTLRANVTAKIIDSEGENTVQLVDGMTITASSFYADAAQLTLSNGAKVQILGASKFKFQLGANALAGDTAAVLTYPEFVTSLGASLSGALPASGTAGYVVPTGFAQASTPVPAVAGNASTVPGTLADDVLVPSGGNNYLGGGGSDAYIISPYTLSGAVTTKITDTEGTNVIQLVNGLTIASSDFFSNAVQLRLSNGAIVQILNASGFSYQLGANAPAGETATSLSYAEFAVKLGASVPTGTGAVSGSANFVVSRSAP